MPQILDLKKRYPELQRINSASFPVRSPEWLLFAQFFKLTMKYWNMKPGDKINESFLKVDINRLVHIYSGQKKLEVFAIRLCDALYKTLEDPDLKKY